VGHTSGLECIADDPSEVPGADRNAHPTCAPTFSASRGLIVRFIRLEHVKLQSLTARGSVSAAWWLLGLGIAATPAANVVTGWGYGPAGAAVPA
jgi:hypothetical protein